MLKTKKRFKTGSLDMNSHSLENTLSQKQSLVNAWKKVSKAFDKFDTNGVCSVHGFAMKTKTLSHVSHVGLEWMPETMNTNISIHAETKRPSLP